MQVESEAKPNGKRIAIVLTEDDVFPDGAGPVTLLDKWRQMSRTADSLLIEYMYRNGDVSKEFADQRIRELRDS